MAAKKAKDKDKELEEKIEKIVEKKVTEFFAEKKQRSKKTTQGTSAKVFGEFLGFGILVVILLVIFPRLPFVTDAYSQWLPIAFWAGALGAILKVLKHSSGVNALARLFEIGDLLTSIYSTHWLITIYPLDFSAIGIPELNYYFRLFLYLAILLMGIGIFANFVRMFASEENKN